MKITITESQYSDLKFRRTYRKIQDEFDHKLDIYIPCNYNYEGGEYDFFNDVKYMNHHYKGVHPIRFNEESIYYINILGIK